MKDALSACTWLLWFIYLSTVTIQVLMDTTTFVEVFAALAMYAILLLIPIGFIR